MTRTLRSSLPAGRNQGLAAVGLAMLILAAAAPAAAQSLPEVLSGAELRRGPSEGGDRRYDVWRLNADGSFAGSFTIEHNTWSANGYSEHGAVDGRWRLADGQLCVAGRGLERAGEICFTMEPTGGTDLTLQYRATDTATGRRWPVFVSRTGR